MAAPVVASTSPATGDTDFNYRSSLTATFSVALLSASVNRGTVILYESASGKDIDADVSLSTSGLVVTLIPRTPLKEGTNHIFSLIGNDIGAPGGHIKSSGGDALATTYSVTFRTDTDRYVSLTEATSREDVERVGPIRATEDAGTVSGYLTIDSVTPAGFATHQSRTLSTIEVDFGEAVSLTGTGPALIVTMQPSDGYTRDYGYADSDGNYLYRDAEGDSATDVARRAAITDPVGVVSVSGTKVIWTRDSGYTFPYNAQITVQVDADCIVNGDDEYLEDDVYFFFTTTYWPVYGSPMVLRIEVGPSIKTMYDDTLYRILFKNTLRALWESSDNAGLDDTRNRPYPNTERFVKAQSIIDVIDMLRLLADMQSGQTKTLGDFTVKYNATDPSLVSKRKEAEKERNKALRELRFYRGNLGPRSVVKSGDYDGERADYNMRTWDSLIPSSRPMGNTADDRAMFAALRTDHANALGNYVRMIVDADQEIMISGDDFVRILRPM